MSEDVPGRPRTSLRTYRDVLAPSQTSLHVWHLTATPQMTSSRNPAGRVPLTRDEVMTTSEVSELLHLPVSTVYYLARRGELPDRSSRNG